MPSAEDLPNQGGGARQRARNTTAGAEIREMTLKGWSKGKGAPHFEKHGEGMGFTDLKEYTDAAKALAVKIEAVIESKVGNIIFKYDKHTQRILIVHAKDRTIKTFYKANNGLKSFKEAMLAHLELLP